MAIIVNLDVMMAKRKMSLNELSSKVDITLSNLSILKTGKPRPYASARSKLYVLPSIASLPTYSNMQQMRLKLRFNLKTSLA